MTDSCNEAQRQRDGVTNEVMSRTTQTWRIFWMILVATAAIITTYIVMENKKAYEEKYPGCWRLLYTDNQCEVEHSLRVLSRY